MVVNFLGVLETYKYENSHLKILEFLDQFERFRNSQNLIWLSDAPDDVNIWLRSHNALHSLYGQLNYFTQVLGENNVRLNKVKRIFNELSALERDVFFSKSSINDFIGQCSTYEAKQLALRNKIFSSPAFYVNNRENQKYNL